MSGGRCTYAVSRVVGHVQEEGAAAIQGQQPGELLHRGRGHAPRPADGTEADADDKAWESAEDVAQELRRQVRPCGLAALTFRHHSTQRTPPTKILIYRGRDLLEFYRPLVCSCEIRASVFRFCGFCCAYPGVGPAVARDRRAGSQDLT